MWELSDKVALNEGPVGRRCQREGLPLPSSEDKARSCCRLMPPGGLCRHGQREEASSFCVETALNWKVGFVTMSFYRIEHHIECVKTCFKETTSLAHKGAHKA